MRLAQRGGAFLLATLLVALPAPAGANAASTTPYGVNLLKNRGAEHAPVGSEDLPSWDHAIQFERVAYQPDGDKSGFPTESEAARVHGGSDFFSCGPNAASGIARQIIELHGRGSDIDGGRVRVTASVLIATYPDGDSGSLKLNVSTNGSTYPELKHSDSIMSLGTFRKVTLTAELPAGAKAIEFVMSGIRANGAYCDAYFDNASLVLTRMPTTGLRTNLLANPGAEQKPVMGEPPHWSSEGVTVVKYGASSKYPSTAVAAAIHGGNRLFNCVGRPTATYGLLTQAVTIYGRLAAIDAGSLKAVLTLRLGTRHGSDADFYVSSFDAWGTQVSTHTQHNVMAAGMTAEKRTFTLPAGAVKVVANIYIASANSGTACRGFVDNISLTLKAA